MYVTDKAAGEAQLRATATVPYQAAVLCNGAVFRYLASPVVRGELLGRQEYQGYLVELDNM